MSKDIRDTKHWIYNDVVHHVSYLVNSMRRELTLNSNISKLSVRYKGLTYSDTAAQERADKQE